MEAAPPRSSFRTATCGVFASAARTLIASRAGRRSSSSSASGMPIRVAGVVQAGIISELAEHLSSLLGEERVMSRAVVVLPLREGTSEQAAELLRGGPPFDPEEVGLERHHVFLTEREAVFVFEADSQDAADRLIGEGRFLVRGFRVEGPRRGTAAACRGRVLLGPAARSGRPSRSSPLPGRATATAATSSS